jgi:FKBP12-rapamycin complex-associated protein
MLSELEEVIEFKLMPERQEAIKETWWKRLNGIQRVVEDWQRIMHVRSLVISPQTDQRTWLKYASLCRKSGRLQLSHRALVNILGVDPSDNLEMPLPTAHPRAAFAYCKHLWAAEQKSVAFSQLHCLVKRFIRPHVAQLEQEARVLPDGGAVAVPIDDRLVTRAADMRALLARCYHKLGQWQESLQGISERSIGNIRENYQLATENDITWYKAWHSWAVANFEAVLFYKQQIAQQQQQQQTQSDSQQSTASRPLSTNFISSFAVPAMRGFVRSIALSKGSSLQDTLRLLTLLFDYGHQPDMYEALHESIRTIEIDNWLQVSVQLTNMPSFIHV